MQAMRPGYEGITFLSGAKAEAVAMKLGIWQLKG
jgi:hypothetical protein